MMAMLGGLKPPVFLCFAPFVAVRFLGHLLFYDNSTKQREVFFMFLAIVIAILYIPLGVIFELTKRY